MFLDKLFKAIGDFFSGLFKSAKKTWNKLSPEIQNAMLKGSGLVAIINDNVDKAPDFVIDIIKKKYPDFSIEKIKEAIKKGSEGLTIAGGINDNDLAVTIGNLQKYLSTLEGKTWAKISHTLGLGISAAIAPKETKMAALSSLLDYVYHDLIKGK